MSRNIPAVEGQVNCTVCTALFALHCVHCTAVRARTAERGEKGGEGGWLPCPAAYRLKTILAFPAASGLFKGRFFGLKPSPFHAEHFGISYVIFGCLVFACIGLEGRALMLYIDSDLETKTKTKTVYE